MRSLAVMCRGAARPKGQEQVRTRRPRVPCRAASQAVRQAGSAPAATYQGPSLVLTIPGRRLLFGPAGHFTLQDTKRARLKDNHGEARGRLTSLPRLNSLNQEPGFSLGQEVILA